jgi:hypothetical protein
MTSQPLFEVGKCEVGSVGRSYLDGHLIRRGGLPLVPTWWLPRILPECMGLHRKRRCTCSGKKGEANSFSLFTVSDAGTLTRWLPVSRLRQP